MQFLFFNLQKWWFCAKPNFQCVTTHVSTWCMEIKPINTKSTLINKIKRSHFNIKRNIAHRNKVQKDHRSSAL